MVSSFHLQHGRGYNQGWRKSSFEREGRTFRMRSPPPPQWEDDSQSQWEDDSQSQRWLLSEKKKVPLVLKVLKGRKLLSNCDRSSHMETNATRQAPPHPAGSAHNASNHTQRKILDKFTTTRQKKREGKKKKKNPSEGPGFEPSTMETTTTADWTMRHQGGGDSN